MKKDKSRVDTEFWKEVGLTAIEFTDGIFLRGGVKAALRLLEAWKQTRMKQNPPIDWNYPVEKLYIHEEKILWLTEEEGNKNYLPQSVMLSPEDEINENEIKLNLDKPDFKSNVPVEAGFEFYAKFAKGKSMFDGENARLSVWDQAAKTLTFQGCSYYDYLKTNMSLDMPYLPNGVTLRLHLNGESRLESLKSSQLANGTGINGLVFTNDGHMIFQKRADSVLVRPGELCSGFSGTLEKDDIANALKSGGFLSDLDIERELRKELAIKHEEVISRTFLGITRELVRGGAPEIFYAVDVAAKSRDILSRLPEEKEGRVLSVPFGSYARSCLSPEEALGLPKDFTSLIGQLYKKGLGHVSIPFITNLALWYQKACPGYVGASPMPVKSTP